MTSRHKLNLPHGHLEQQQTISDLHFLINVIVMQLAGMQEAVVSMATTNNTI